jgi:hypothetical protein
MARHVAWALATLMVTAGVCPAMAAEPDSPITWRNVSETAPVTQGRATMTALAEFGDVGITGVTLVRITDRDILGVPVNDKLAYLFRFSHALSGYGNNAVVIDVIVAVDATVDRLLLAFTPPKGEWADCAELISDETELLFGERLHYGLPKEPLHSTVRDVLNVLCERESPRFLVAGQVVIRPRSVDFRTWVYAEMEPIRVHRSGDAWVVQIMGSVLVPRVGPGFAGLNPDDPLTQAAYLIADGSLDFWKSVLHR